MADQPTIARVDGTMLVPGVSRNRRLYKPEVIAKAVERMQARIADPKGLPIVMRTHHGADDNSALIVGRVANVRLDETGAAKYTALLYDTQPGRDIATLVTPKEPALKSVSIHGYWLGPVKRVQHEGEAAETADDLEVDAVDWTATPGVTGAVVDAAAWTTGRTTESATGRTPIAESVDAHVSAIVEDAPAPSIVEAKDPTKPYGDVQYADPGYLADKQKRYPLDTETRIRAAWSYINQKDTAAQYTAKQLGRIKGRIKAAMKRIGADVSDESTSTRYGELREYWPDGPGGDAGFCVDAYNGPLSITMRACGIAPAALRAITTAAMNAACDALQAMDPDMDADIDVPGAPTEDTDGDKGKPRKESIPAAVDDGEFVLTKGVMTLNEMRTELGIPALDGHDIPVSPPLAAAATVTETTPDAGASNETQEVPAVSEATEAAETTAPTPTGRTLSNEDITALGALFGAALKEHVAPLVTALGETQKPKPAKETSESAAAPTAESTTKAGKSAKKQLKETAAALETSLRDQLKESLAAERTRIRDEVREEFLRENGLPGRKGYRVHENDQSTLDAEALFDQHRTDILLGDFGKTPVPAPGTGTAPDLVAKTA